MENLEMQLKQQIIEALNLEEITAEEIATDAPLFGEGLGLDSIDALEITLLLEKHYGDRKSTRLNSSHTDSSRMPSSA